MSRLDGQPGILVDQDSTDEQLRVYLYEDSPLPTLTDATALTLRLNARDGSLIYADNLITPPTPPGATRIVNESTGVYTFQLGDPTLFPLTPGGASNQETALLRTMLATWTGVGTVGSPQGRKRQIVEVVSTEDILLTEQFRQYIDKDVKRVNLESPNRRVRLGYTPFQLYTYLNDGLAAINAYPPYPTFASLSEWSGLLRWSLFEAALIAGLTAQALYAADTDIPNWSDQGNAFVIDHFPKLTQMLQAIQAKLDALIPKLKFQHFVGGPSGKVEAGPNARLNALIQMSPNGALFRNLVFR